MTIFFLFCSLHCFQDPISCASSCFPFRSRKDKQNLAGLWFKSPVILKTFQVFSSHVGFLTYAMQGIQSNRESPAQFENGIKTQV